MPVPINHKIDSQQQQIRSSGKKGFHQYPVLEQDLILPKGTSVASSVRQVLKKFNLDKRDNKLSASVPDSEFIDIKLKALSISSHQFIALLEEV